MTKQELQDVCEQGSRMLVETEYLAAEKVLAGAEKIAWENQWWETLARVYMPLQEARRQARQRRGEGVVKLDVWAENENDVVKAGHVLDHWPHGQLLVAGWGTIRPAVDVRREAAERGLYVETFLGAVYPIGGKRAIVIVPTEDVRLPAVGEVGSIDELMKKLPVNALVSSEDQIVRGERKGTTETYAEVMGMWEKLHLPFLAAADAEAEPVRKMEGYRRTIRVDPACELAHQRLADVARGMARDERNTRRS
jgi:hypothetical protein